MVVPDLVPSSVCVDLIDELPLSAGSGTRALLDESRYQELARTLRSHLSLQFALDNLVAVQAIFFNKTSENNWSLQMHSDTVFPIKGEGTWQAAGVKEGLPYVHVPREDASRFVAVRLSLDSAAEGDLSVEPGSHWPNPEAERASVVVPVSQGAALVLNPSIRHGSSKLQASSARRVVHIVYAPRTLPDSYSWCQAI